MGFVHGKDAQVELDDNDLSEYSNSIAFNRSADSHDTTTYGKNSKTYKGGLKDGTCTIEGIYDSDETSGPRAVIEPLLGKTVTFTYRPEGAGDGKPEDTGEAVVTSYEETTPVADMITWQCELQLSGDVTPSKQTEGGIQTVTKTSSV